MPRRFLIAFLAIWGGMVAALFLVFDYWMLGAILAVVGFVRGQEFDRMLKGDDLTIPVTLLGIDLLAFVTMAALLGLDVHLTIQNPLMRSMAVMVGFAIVYGLSFLLVRALLGQTDIRPLSLWLTRRA